MDIGGDTVGDIDRDRQKELEEVEYLVDEDREVAIHRQGGGWMTEDTKREKYNVGLARVFYKLIHTSVRCPDFVFFS